MLDLRRTISALCLAGVMGGGLPTQANQQETPFAPFIGEITENRVNIRSGPSTNYYVVTKLGAGARVRVIGEGEGDWVAIEPPEGVFSVIAKRVVDRGDNDAAVVNTNRVRVYADAANRKQKRYAYNYHPRLSRGTIVHVVESAAGADDEYFRIVPPDGAKVWVHGDYVVEVPAEVLAAEAQSVTTRATPKSQSQTEATTAAAVVAAGPSEPVVSAATAASETEMPTSAVSGSTADVAPETTRSAVASMVDGTDRNEPGGDEKARLAAVEGAFEKELLTPAGHREFGALIERYRKLAAQDTDRYVQAFAAARLEQIDYLNTVSTALTQIRQLSDDVRAGRKRRLAERAALRPGPPQIEDVFDVQGVLRVSAIYSSPVGPRRYRLVDPTSSTTRTIAYVEIPADASYDVNKLIGQRVGVRARSRILQTGGVEPIVVYVADELVVLEGIDEMTNHTAHTAEATSNARP